MGSNRCTGRARRTWQAPATALALAVSLCVLFTAGELEAATIVVTTTADELNKDGDCSLREAVQAANTNARVDACIAGSGNDTINLDNGTYTLTRAGAGENDNATGDLDVGRSGVPAGEKLLVAGKSRSGTVISGGQIDRVFHLLPTGHEFELRSLTVRDGRVADGGAGVFAHGPLALREVVIENNTVTGANDDSIGGGVCVCGGSGAVENVMDNVIVRQNLAERGGGIFNNRPLLISRSSIYLNVANRAGGGLVNYGNLTVTNVTLTTNSAPLASALTHDAGNLSLYYDTISHNSASGGHGGAVYFSGPAKLQGTIIAANDPYDCQMQEAPYSLGYNLAGDDSCDAALAGTGDKGSTNPLLGALDINTGSSPARPLLPGSPAIDAGGLTGCPEADQHGVGRPQGKACDIGAIERKPTRLKLLPGVRKSG
jgi:CSLREA domain-containing protein